MPPKTNAFYRKALPTRKVLTTADRVIAHPVDAHVIEKPSTVVQRERGTYSYRNDDAMRLGAPPLKPTDIAIDGDTSFAVGVYLIAAGTAAGKTVASIAIAAWANANGVPATYMSTFEPRSPRIADGDTVRFTVAKKYISDCRSLIPPSRKPKLIVLDSITLGMKANAESFKFQSTFSGGMQPSDRGFLDEMSELARDRNACIMCVLNTTLIPYVADLEGAVEGLIRISSPSTLSVTDRTEKSSRKSVPVIVPTVYVQYALDELGYGTYKPGTAKNYRRAIIGLNQ